MAAAPRLPDTQRQRATSLFDLLAGFYSPETTNQAGAGATRASGLRQLSRPTKQTYRYHMNTLMLRTRFVNADPPSSSSLISSYAPRSVRPAAQRQMRPVFISSPSPKKSHARVPRRA